MKTIYKYPVVADDYFELSLPIGAQILTVQEQYGDAQLWALVDPSANLQTRRFRLAGTGHPIKEDNLQYIGTFQINGGMLVFHLFEILPLLIEGRQ